MKKSNIYFNWFDVLNLGAVAMFIGFIITLPWQTFILMNGSFALGILFTIYLHKRLKINHETITEKGIDEDERD